MSLLEIVIIFARVGELTAYVRLAFAGLILQTVDQRSGAVENLDSSSREPLDSSVVSFLDGDGIINLRELVVWLFL